MQYTYSAKDDKGNIIKGTLEAASEISAANALRAKALFLLDLKTKKSPRAIWQRRVPLKERIIFTQQLEIMVRSGLPLVDAITSLQEETENKRFASELSQVVASVETGSLLSDALAKFPKTFSEVYVNLVRSGEKTGQLDKVLQRLSGQLQKDFEVNRKVKGALSYPLFILTALIGVMVLILNAIIPQLQQIFDDVGAELPLSTRIVIGASKFTRSYGVFTLAFIIVAIVLISRWLKTAQGKRFFDRFLLKIPVIGLLLRKSYLARLTRTFAALSNAGLPVLEALRVSSNVIGNSVYEREVVKVADRVKNGQTISKAFGESPLFPAMIMQLASVGEKSGNIGEVFDSLADFFDRDVDSITTNLSTMLEPLLVIILGVGIAAIIISVLQPIYGLVNTM
ncbi:MAG: type II secretion system F family protein [Patescibacteria group bacterium]|jgi:type IV pilus assembly protein PilC